MKGELHLFVNTKHVETRRDIDVARGKVTEEKVSAGDFCKSLGLSYVAMTPEIMDLVLYERRGKGEGAEPHPVKVGDVGPFVLVRILDGQIQNEYSARDLCKPVSLSADTLRELSGIFRGKGAIVQQ
jgi:hypothetical protein